MKNQDNLGNLEQSERDLVSREQLAEHRKTVITAVTANLVNAVILFTLFYKQVPAHMLILWCGILGFVVVDRVRLAKASNGSQMSRKKMLRLKKRITINAAVLAHIWGVGVACLLPIAAPAQLMLLAAIGAGKMTTGVITYRHLPEAARAWTIIISVSLVIGLTLQGTIESFFTMGLLAMFAMVLLVSSSANFSGFVNQILSQKEISKSAETVRLLLNDFEEQSANWLFSIDQEGKLIDVCDRFADAAHLSKTDLKGHSIVSLIEDEEVQWGLMNKISHGTPFRDMVVSVQADGEQRWWTISARAASESVNNKGIFMRGVISDITAQKKAEEKVSYMAHFDGLTDLPNRRFFSETLNRTIHRAQEDDNIALLFFDLDHFKAINDTLGHPIGDKFLKLLSRRLEVLTRPGDLLARVGGDEFALLLTGERARNGAEIAETIVEEAAKPFLIDDHNIISSCSVGLSSWDVEMDDPDTLVKYADLALYSAKGAGRNRIAVFEEGMDVAAEERRNLELDLRASLGRDEMRLHYQPLVDLKSQTKTGYEALLRWEHPERGVVMPDEFISVAEETGMIVQLGEWVIRKALQDAASWENNMTVAVNLSPSQMRSSGLVPTIVNALAQTGLDPSRLELEITENILMQDSEANIKTLHNLRELGIRISLDDFGTGYSSLNYLRSFPFDKIKIDRCFVSEIDSREDCRAIIRSVISLAQDLGMTTTAEGVERTGQAKELEIEGCDQVQGYLYGKAESLDSCTDLRSSDVLAPNIETIYLPAADIQIESTDKKKRA